MADGRRHISDLLRAHRNGDAQATEALFALIYRELKAIAHRQLGHRQAPQTINTTALVHEAYLKLAGQGKNAWRDKAHLLAVAATAMRHFLVDNARKRQAEKRGGQVPHIRLDASALFEDGSSLEMLDLDAALTLLAASDPRLAQVVELHFFGGLSTAETAEVLGISPRTVRRDLFKARTFLHLVLGGKEEG